MRGDWDAAPRRSEDAAYDASVVVGERFQRPPAPSAGDVDRIASDICAPNAAAVDRAARFPSEAIAALRSTRLLGVSMGAAGTPPWPLADIARATAVLGRACSATGMIWAMHHSQAIAVRQHAPLVGEWGAARARIAIGETLIASVASEGSGDLFTTEAAIAPLNHTGLHEIVKEASAASFGAEADAMLVSARRDAAVRSNDLVLALVWGTDATREPLSEWNALGMRGTRTIAVRLRGYVRPWQVLPDPFAVIYRLTVIPVAHVLWSSCWIGITEAAVAVASRCVRERRSSGSAAIALGDAAADLNAARALTRSAIDRCEEILLRPERFQAIADASVFNELKLQVSTLTNRAVLTSLQIIGIGGYMEDGERTIARQVRDILSAPLMISNYRLRDASADLEFARRER